jgi:hypothetical protein
MTLVGLLAGRSWFRVASWYVRAVSSGPVLGVYCST